MRAAHLVETEKIAMWCIQTAIIYIYIYANSFGQERIESS